jgi:hypothetical protein
MYPLINKNAAGSAMISVFIAFVIFVTVMVLAYKYLKKSSYQIPHYYAYIKDEKDTSHNDYTKYLILK